MKKLKNLFANIAPPVLLGIFITMIICYLGITLYIAKASGRDHDTDFVTKLIKILDQKSADLRLQARGERSGSPEVAMLTVDERAIKEVGRWPWPRSTIAKAIDNAVNYGAKVIAMDVVWSEPSDRPELRFAKAIEPKLTTIPHIKKNIEETLKTMNDDLIFAKTIEKHSNNIVMGSFFASITSTDNYNTACQNMVYEQSPTFSIWDNEEAIVGSSDLNEYYIPTKIYTVYQTHFDDLKKKRRAEYPPPRNLIERASIERAIHQELDEFCQLKWLNSETDSIYDIIDQHWEDLTADEDDFNFKSFAQWIDYFKSNYVLNQIPQAQDWVMNTPLISEGVKHTGFFNAALDDDGTIRKSRLIIRNGNHYMPSIGFKAFLVAKNYNSQINFEIDPNLEPSGEAPSGFKGPSEIEVTDNETGNSVFTIPVDRQGQININYAGPQKMFPYVSLADLISTSDSMRPTQMQWNESKKVWNETRIPVKKSEFLKDKIFILGVTATAVYDLRVTPFDENFPGAETHVNVIDNLLRRDFLRVHPQERPYMLSFLFIGGLLLSIIMSRLGSVSGLITAGGLIATILLFDRYYLFENGILVSIILPLLLISTIFLGLTFFKYFTEERNKKELRSTFSKYVSPAIVDEILDDPSNIELGGTKKDITVFFSDIRGFTTISEKLDPKALSDLLNSYLTPMTDIVFENKGTLDKYMGDAVMAFFGAPISQKSHPADACRAALDSLEKLKELQIQYKEQGLPIIDIGIGINTGDCSVGNMGSETVRNYTVMGDAVNLGSRLEGINKQYGTRIIISEFTYDRIKDDFICREIDLVRVKGKLLPVKIYELVAEKKIPDTVKALLDEFNKGYDLYHQRDFQQAIEVFTEALNINPTDKCSKLYITRCQDYLKTPPPEDWDGSFTMTTK